jgi:glycosyltransferase involved in cell wall biosynthesis
MKTICLTMIVKNESAILEKTLINILEHIPIHYWVISDTGSTDTTPNIIQTFFNKKQIPGELVYHEWKDFGHNRTLVLQSAFNKTDYVFMFDADDSIQGQLLLPSLKEDMYKLQFGQSFTYYRPLLFTNRKQWKYKGVLHEFLEQIPSRTCKIIQGKYFIHSGRDGFRNQDKNKYEKDAIILEKAFYEDPGLQGRYAFYCAQSYRDAKQKEKAVEWYKKVLTIPNHWKQEYYYSCLQLGWIYQEWKQMDLAVHYWLKTVEYDRERIEGIVMALDYFYSQQNYILINSLYHTFKSYTCVNNKLFLHQYYYQDRIEYYNAIAAYYVNDFKSGYDCCVHVLKNRKVSPSELNTIVKYLDKYK